MPGTNNLRKLIEVAGGRVLILCDEVLNFLSRHRDRAESFRYFLANLVRTLIGTTGSAAMVSLPQSKPEMSDWDLRWQDIITHEVMKLELGVVVGRGLEPTIEEFKEREEEKEPALGIQTRTLHLVGTVPPEIWNRLGTKIIPKLKSGADLKIGVDFSITINAESARSIETDLRQVLEDLGLASKIKIEQS